MSVANPHLPEPYYSDDLVTLYHSEYADVIDALASARADAVITDPPYGETSLLWDTWPVGWVSRMEPVADALWCFGSFRMFMDNLSEFGDWKFSHEIVWEKHNGSGFATDKFRRVHELATFWYRGAWGDIRHEVPRVKAGPENKGRVSRGKSPEHAGKINKSTWLDDGTRMQKSVLQVPSMQANAVHPTQKPLAIVAPLIEYSVPVGGTVVDPFAGSGTTLLAAKLSGRHAIGCEANEKYCEAAARRLSQQTFQFEGIGA